MKKVFYNILLPVFLKKDTESSLLRAVHLSNRLQCNLHVIYTMPPMSSIEEMIPGRNKKLVAEKKAMLFGLQQKFEPLMRKGSLYFSQFLQGDPVHETVEYAFSRSVDLICYDEHSSILHPPSVNFQRLSEMAHCPVLTGSATIKQEHVDKIVLPIDDQLSAERVRVAIFMAQQLGAAIHLVGDAGESGHTRSVTYLKKAYELLKDNTSLELVCSTFSGSDTTQSTMNYAKSVRAGLIVVNKHQGVSENNREYSGFVNQRGVSNSRAGISILMV